ncbi:MAG: 2-oxoacid:acceptor oxidoreductase subunit alpha [Leptospiraceae bacterium]|nr:2-oxoacid:acceptor oxidoreductase subunit alpha [Leptospiraceae bacterium]MCP5499582.1 2-oxoacid:acceptor oxidoreductase subunit alpha [Leptospiraceae bacterium]
MTQVAEIKKIAVKDHVVEFVSDAGEGAQKAGVTFAKVSARMGNSLWTVEIIPSEIQPPPHTVGSASGNRIRLGTKTITNGGNRANVVLAFNEMSLLSRVQNDALSEDVIVIIDNQWATHELMEIREGYRKILNDLKDKGARIYEIPIEEETKKILDDPRQGKNMFALGVLSFLYSRDLEILRQCVSDTFEKKSDSVQEKNIALVENGYYFAEKIFDYQFEIDSIPLEKPMVAMNGNQAIALGTIAAGFELCSMYPITPATSASHFLSSLFESFGGFVHQAEDEIAAIGVAVGAAYAGKPALTITSGPGMALKTEFLGLTVMTETPLVVVDVQRGGPSTGLPTKIEQSDLLASLYSTPGDAPKVILAPATIEECYYIMKTARKIAEDFRMLVIILSDANLATGVQLFPRPEVKEGSIPPAPSRESLEPGSLGFDWDAETGLSQRLIPGQKNGVGMTSSLNHNRAGLVRYDTETNELGHTMRSRKLAVLQKSLKLPEIMGEEEGDLLILGWGSTKGAIEEAVRSLQEKGHKISSLHLRFICPLPSGLKEVFQKFKKVMTVELNYSDPKIAPYIDSENRRMSQLALYLRAHTLTDIDCYSRVLGRPIMPGEIEEALSGFLKEIK